MMPAGGELYRGASRRASRVLPSAKVAVGSVLSGVGSELGFGGSE
jgi:hypothetical protein